MTCRMVILAAGEGTRLRPLTDQCPKGLVEVADKPLVNWQIEAAWRLGLREISVVTGYRAEKFKEPRCRWYHNPHYAETNMVETLWCATPEFKGELIVSYGDIIYENSVLETLIKSETPISVVIDLDWRPYWEARFTDPLSDAETLRVDDEGHILEIGQKPGTIDEIQGQYIGLMKFKSEGLDALQSTYQALKDDKMSPRSSQPFQKMYMTDLLQAIIDAGHPVHAVPIHRKWLEIDSMADYHLANQHAQGDPNGLAITI